MASCHSQTERVVLAKVFCKIGQEALDLAHGHAAGVHGNDLVVEAGEAARVLRDQVS